MRKEAELELFTYKDLEALPEDPGRRYEIIDGELFVTPAPVPRHQLIVQELFLVLHAHVDAKKLGILFCTTVDVYFTETNVLEPDLVFFRQRSMMKRKFIEGAPDLVVEVLSKATARRDRTTKMRVYERFGVRHYWIVNPFANELEEYVLRGAGFVRRSLVAGNKTFQPACFPGLKVPLKKLWSV